MFKQAGIHDNWNNITRIMSTQIVHTTVIPADKKVIHLRKVSAPSTKVRNIYKACDCEMTQKAKKKFVVYH
jgi:hypothetical protein